MRRVNMDLSTTKKYVQQLKEMDAKEAIQLLEDQISTIKLHINNQILKQLEILDGSSSWKERAEASSHIAILTQAVSKIAEQKNAVMKALGTDMGDRLPEANPTVAEEPKEVGEDDFTKEYALLQSSNAPPNA